MANNIQDGGLYLLGSYDPLTGITTLNTSILNIANTSVTVAGVTAFSGTYSIGGAHVVTVSKGIITTVS